MIGAEHDINQKLLILADLGVHVNRDVNQKFTYEYLIFSSLLQVKDLKKWRKSANVASFQEWKATIQEFRCFYSS